jgi:hypothetical protein
VKTETVSSVTNSVFNINVCPEFVVLPSGSFAYQSYCAFCCVSGFRARFMHKKRNCLKAALQT